MDLNINSPSYYTEEFGVDSDIYWMCRDLAAFVKEKEYSDIIKIIGIVPIIAPESVLAEKDTSYKRCLPKSRLAMVSLPMDYEEYVRADIPNKKKLIINNVLASVKAVFARGKINYSLFEEDMKKFCEINDIPL